MNTNLQNTVALVARIMMAAIFLTSGFGKLTGFEGTVGYIASKHVFMPQVAAVVAILAELGGGLLLLVGFKARYAGLVLAIFTVAAAALFHDFWAADAAAKMNQTIHFWKNITMAGGLLMVFAFGPGRYSVDKA